jgi:hypothetical protein
MIVIAIELITLLFILNLLVSLLHRFKHGVSLGKLINSHFYEILPIRSLLWTMLISFGYLDLFITKVFIHHLYPIIFDSDNPPESIVPVIASGISVAGMSGLIWALSNYLLKVPNYDSTSIKSDRISTSYGIPSELLKNLGSERFPNQISAANYRDKTIRILIVIQGLIAIAVISFLVFNHEKYHLTVDLDTTIATVKSNYPPLVNGIFIGLMLTTPTSIALLLWNNRDYTLLTLPKTLYFKIIFLVIFIDCTIWMGLNFYPTVIVGSIVIIAYAVRSIVDLTLEIKYQKIKSVYNPIAQKIKSYTPYLDLIASDPNLNLGDCLELESLIERIDRGCKNIEERGIFVTRNFAQLLKIIKIHHQEFAVAMLRYLTVNRYMTRADSFATNRCLQDPHVPIWDLMIFPLHPPSGYLDWLDPLRLPSRWDIIETCDGCNGSGNVSTGNEGERTCGSCDGCGKLKYPQILTTQWQKLLPLVTYPEIPTPELVEYAEEQIVYQLAFTENFSACNQSARVRVASNPLTTKMDETVRQLEKFQQFHQQEVADLQGGLLYRADFQIACFRTIAIEFANFGGSRGWFFGKRPEFYFPRLPLSWSTVLTFVLLPPLWVVLFTSLLKISFKVFPLLVS